MKLTVVGGGSTYTPELIEGIATRPADLAVTEIVLVDPDTHRLGIVGGFCRRLLDAAGHPARLVTTSDLEDGAEGASAVLLQLRVGGQGARRADETFPLDSDCVGQETTGAGGLAKAVRTVPVVLDIARRVRAVTDGWIVNFTNPVGIVTRALCADGHRALGLCNVAITFQRWVAGLLERSPESVRIEHVGLNHLTWVRRVQVDGADVLPDLLQRRADELAEHLGHPTGLLRRLGSVPSYYLKYFYAHDEMVRRGQQQPPRADVVREVERELLNIYADPEVSSKPELLSRRGGAYYSQAAVGLVRALLSHDGTEHVVNVRNSGTLPFLPDDAMIETNSIVDERGAEPIPVSPLEPELTGLIAQVAGYERLALRAAVDGGRDQVAAALLAHPLIGQYAVAEELADALIARNARFLPWAHG